MEKVSETRNFVVAGHSGCGKTTLCDLMLFKAGAVERLGSVDQKTSISDYTPEEQDKQASIYSSPLNCTWKGEKLLFRRHSRIRRIYRRNYCADERRRQFTSGC